MPQPIFLFLILSALFFSGPTAYSQSGKPRTTTKPPTEITWQQNRKLTWADFRGKPDATIDKEALTVSSLKIGYSCDGTSFTYLVQPTFVPTESWTKDRTSKELLAHEQLHFDIAEVHARKLRKVFSMLPQSCAVPEKELQKLINQPPPESGQNGSGQSGVADY